MNELEKSVRRELIGRRFTDKWQGECYISRIRRFPKFLGQQCPRLWRAVNRRGAPTSLPREQDDGVAR